MPCLSYVGVEYAGEREREPKAEGRARLGKKNPRQFRLQMGWVVGLGSESVWFQLRTHLAIGPKIGFGTVPVYQ